MFERINLVPHPPLAERIRGLILPATGILLILVIIFLGAGNLLLKTKINSLDREIATAKRQADEITVFQARVGMLAADIKRQKEEKERLSAEAAKLSAIHGKKKQFSQALGAIAAALPPSVRCEKITFQDDGGQIMGNAVQYRELPNLAKNLNANPLFAGAILHELDKNPDAKKTDFNFTISFQLKQEGETP